MITPTFGLTATERVLPKLALNFTTASLDPRVTFTRTTGASNPATYVNSSGIVAAATNNQPRFDYDPVTLACKGLLIEESRTNLCTYSEDQTNAAWLKNACSVSANAITAPDGTLTADKLVEASTTATHLSQNTITVAVGTDVYAISGFLKAGERTTARLGLNHSGAPYYAFDVAVDLTTGVLTPNAAGGAVNSYSSINMGNGWWYITVAGYTNTTGTHNPRVTIGTGSYTGNGSSGIYVWGLQVEKAAFATSYIPTTTTALTRNADVAVMTGTNFSDWFNASEGTFVASNTFLSSTAVSPGGSSARVIHAVGTNNDLYVYRQTSTNLIKVGGTFNSANQADFATFGATTVVGGTGYTTSFGYKLNNFGGSTNGLSANTDTSATVPINITSLNIGQASAGVGTLNGHVNSVLFYSQRLTNKELQAFSK